MFDRLDDDGSGTVEFGEFMRTFGPAIAGETMPIMMDGEERQVGLKGLGLCEGSL